MSCLRFTATAQQVREACALAVNASSPMGMGWLHFQAGHEFTADDIKPYQREDGTFDLDYVEGRMVKLYIRRLSPERWEIWSDPPRSDYQSWCRTYPSYRDLLTAAGVTKFNEVTE